MNDHGRAQLHLIVDRTRFPRDLVRTVARALDGGVDWVQLRDHGAPAADVYALARELARICRPAGAGLIINDRVDVALAVGADGVHLGKRSLPPAVVRTLVASWQLIGCSVHAPAEAAESARGGADYVTFGHVFATASHPGVPPTGVAALRRAVEASVPVLAVGGITPENVAEVAATGCAGIAVVGAILGAPDPADAARAFRRALEELSRPRYPFPDPSMHGPARQAARTSARGGEHPDA